MTRQWLGINNEVFIWRLLSCPTPNHHTSRPGWIIVSEEKPITAFNF